jgi:hypothetical protein
MLDGFADDEEGLDVVVGQKWIPRLKNECLENFVVVLTMHFYINYGWLTVLSARILP